MRRADRIALLVAALAAGAAEARPADPGGNSVEFGGSAFVLADRSDDRTDIVAGPQLHLAVRTPLGRTGLQAGITSRFGLAAQARGSSPAGTIALEARGLTGGRDVVPYALGGVGVMFRSTGDRSINLGLIQSTELVLPVGVGIDLRVGDETMLGIALRYTLIATAFSTTTGPFDLTISLVFL